MQHSLHIGCLTLTYVNAPYATWALSVILNHYVIQKLLTHHVGAHAPPMQLYNQIEQVMLCLQPILRLSGPSGMWQRVIPSTADFEIRPKVPAQKVWSLSRSAYLP